MCRVRLPLCGLLACVVSICAWSQRGGGGGSGRSAGATGGTRLDPLSSSVPPSAYVPPTSVHADQEAKVVFKSQTVLVQVPVVVTDKSGNHVHSLTKDDFKVFENGKEQKIAACEEVVASQGRLQPPENQPNTFSNLAQDKEKPRAVMVFVIDAVNTPFLDQAYGRKQLIKYLAENLEPGQALALVSIGSRGMKVLSGLTTDPAVLITALKKVNGEISAMQGINSDTQTLAAVTTPTLGGASELSRADFFDAENAESGLKDFVASDDVALSAFEQERAIEDTLQSFLEIAQSLSGVPGRKSLIWATGGFPFYMDSASAVPGGNLSILYERAMAAMNDAQISVYPVDARGLVSYSPVADATIGPGSAARSTILHGQGMTQLQVGRAWLQASTIETLQDFAAMTGGRAFYNRNDLTTGFKLAADDSSSYYLLGYYLDTQNDKPGWRKLQVKTGHKDAQVRSRSGFFVTNATVDPTLSHQLDITSALSSPFDSTGIPVSVQWQTTTDTGDKRKVGFAITLPTSGVLIDQANNNYFDLEFVAQPSRNGHPATPVGQTVHGNLPPDKLAYFQAHGIRYPNSLQLPPGDYQVRFVVRDNLSGRVGSVSAPLTVK
jgi:VWFA-related protein